MSLGPVQLASSGNVSRESCGVCGREPTARPRKHVAPPGELRALALVAEARRAHGKP